MFEQDLKYAEIGEMVAWNLLSKNPSIVQVLDVRHEPKFQKMDVDFIAITHTKNYVFVEVKTDEKAHESGNIVYEISSNGNLGCFARTDADYVYYYVRQTGDCHLINVRALRDYIDMNRLEVKKMGDGAQGFLIPIKTLISKGIIVKTERMELNGRT